MHKPDTGCFAQPAQQYDLCLDRHTLGLEKDKFSTLMCVYNSIKF